MCTVSTQGIEVVLEERERTGGEDRRGKRVREREQERVKRRRGRRAFSLMHE